jgi:peptidyl-prolyl cis-trans isomerase SurA
MYKQLASLVVALIAIVNIANSQTLFTYGKKVVTKEEFLKAFNKNPSLEKDRKKALREYLELYTNFKLKVQAAYDAKLQNDPNYQYETENFKKQLATNFINDEANIKELVREAFNRSQKDIKLQQIFVEFPSQTDTASAYTKIQKAYFDLRSGKSFNDIAKQTMDPSAIDLGYVTVFTLPYTFENVIYGLKAGEFAAPIRSTSGYHIFYNAAERAAMGRRKAAQILFAVPPGLSANDKALIKAKADSVRNVIAKNPDAWHDMVHQFSNDVTTAENHGEMQEFGIGQFNPGFETAAFELKEVGAISQVVETEYGYHLMKLLQIIPVAKDINDPVVAASFREKVEKDDRLTQARKFLVNKWMKLANYKPVLFDEKELWAFTDSFYNGGSTKGFRKINDSTVIFSFSKQKLTASDFAKYNHAVKAFPKYQAMSYPEILDEYKKAAATEYYQNHLEDYNVEFRSQLKEFNDANLLFAIMDKEVWTKSTTDEDGLKKEYEKHKSKYKWEASANAVIFTVVDENTLKELQQKLNGNTSKWKGIADGFSNKVMADSNRYELGQIPVVDRTNFTDNLITAPVKNNDGSYTFTYIIKVFNEPSQRSFEEARGLVINDYQAVLEQQWLAVLKKKYHVKVNEAVFNSIK